MPINEGPHRTLGNVISVTAHQILLSPSASALLIHVLVYGQSMLCQYFSMSTENLVSEQEPKD